MSDEPPPPKRRWRNRQIMMPSGERQMAERVLKKNVRKESSRLWIERQINDPYVLRAQAEGWRARSAFKLIDDKFHFLKRAARLVDLGAAPGSWAQVAVKRGAGRLGREYDQRAARGNREQDCTPAKDKDQHRQRQSRQRRAQWHARLLDRERERHASRRRRAREQLRRGGCDRAVAQANEQGCNRQRPCRSGDQREATGAEQYAYLRHPDRTVALDEAS